MNRSFTTPRSDSIWTTIAITSSSGSCHVQRVVVSISKIDHRRFRDLIKFETRVDHVVPVPRGSRPLDTKWNVTVLDLKKNNSIQELFDFVVVCNGHYAVPQIPTIPGNH